MDDKRKKFVKRLTNTTLLKKYVEFQKPMSKAPEEFHVFTMIQVISSILGRKTYIRQGTDVIYPNLFTMVVAPSSRFKKSSATKNYLQWLEDLELGPNYLGQIGTIEGLLSTLGRDDLDGKGFVYYDEFGNLFATLKKSYGLDLLEILNEIYGCGVVRRTFKKESYYVPRPYLNIFGATQLDSLTKYIDESALLSGFFPRLLMVYTEYLGEHIAIRPDPNPDLYQEIYSKLLRIKQYVEDMDEEGKQYTLAPEAVDFFVKWSIKMDLKADRTDNRVSTILGRCETLAFKLAMILHTARGRLSNEYIRKDVMVDAIAITNWSINQYEKLVTKKLAWNNYAKYVNKCEEFVKKHKDAALTKIWSHIKTIEQYKVEEIMDGFCDEEYGWCEKYQGPRGGTRYRVIE